MKTYNKNIKQLKRIDFTSKLLLTIILISPFIPIIAELIIPDEYFLNKKDSNIALVSIDINRIESISWEENMYSEKEHKLLNRISEDKFKPKGNMAITLSVQGYNGKTEDLVIYTSNNEEKQYLQRKNNFNSELEHSEYIKESLRNIKLVSDTETDEIFDIERCIHIEKENNSNNLMKHLFFVMCIIFIIILFLLRKKRKLKIKVGYIDNKEV